MEENHWTQDLFPPTFCVNEDEIRFPCSGRATSPAERRPKTRIQAIYERVKSEFDEEVWNARQKSTQVGDSLLEFSAENDNKENKDESEVGKTLTTSDEENMNGDDSSLWDSNEIEVLRSVFLKSRHENSSLKVELGFVKKEIEKVAQKLKEQEKDSELKADREKGIRNAFERLHLENAHLLREVKLLKRRCYSLQEDVDYLTTIKDKLKTEKHEERRQFLQEQARRRELEISLRKFELRTKTSEAATVETLKLNYEMKTSKLLDDLQETRESLNGERAEHKRTKKALDHMRYHFASLPLEPVSVRSVSKDDDDVLNNLQLF